MSAPWTGQTGIDALANADLFLVVDSSESANRTVSSTQVLTFIENELSSLNKTLDMNSNFISNIRGIILEGPAGTQPHNIATIGDNIATGSSIGNWSWEADDSDGNPQLGYMEMKFIVEDDTVDFRDGGIQILITEDGVSNVEYMHFNDAGDQKIQIFKEIDMNSTDISGVDQLTAALVNADGVNVTNNTGFTIVGSTGNELTIAPGTLDTNLTVSFPDLLANDTFALLGVDNEFFGSTTFNMNTNFGDTNITNIAEIRQSGDHATTGFLRLENGSEIAWHNTGNNENNILFFNFLNQFEFAINGNAEFLLDTNRVDITNKDLTSVNAISSGDTTPEEIVKFVSVSSAVKQITIRNADSGGNPLIQATADSGVASLILEGSGGGSVSAETKLIAADDFEVLGVADMDQTLDVAGKITTNDDLQVDKRLLTSEQGGTQTISSIFVTLGESGNVFRLRADSAQFMDSINSTNWTLGSIVVIHFITNNITVRNQETVGEPQRQIHLSTNEFNEIGTLTLYLESGAWIEISRTVLN